MGSSWTRDRTCVPCIGRRILKPWTPRDVLLSLLRKEINHELPSVNTAEMKSGWEGWEYKKVVFGSGAFSTHMANGHRWLVTGLPT